MDYSKLSDQEINMAVAEIFHPDSVVIESKSRPPSACITGHLPSLWVDYCNNPADAWQIILQSRISMVWDCAEDASAEWWNAFDQFDDCRVQYQSNPLRAAMIVFLMMQESANVPVNPARPDIR